MNESQILARLTELGVELPSAPKPVAAYLPVVVSGSTAYVAGQIASVDGELLSPGHLGAEVSIEQGAAAAKRAALQALSALREALGSLDRLRRISQVTVYIASTPEFTDHPKVANGASEFLVEVLGDDGKHARAAVGMSSLPLGASVEVQVTAEVDPA
jgi:enamine deaminase RidA (YjgF/YER057c/UK114 family)